MEKYQITIPPDLHQISVAEVIMYIYTYIRTYVPVPGGPGPVAG